MDHSVNGNNQIWVVACRTTKQAHFIPCRTTDDASTLAQLFIEYVFKYHGFPDSHVTDRNPKFTSKFWTALQKELGIKALMSTAAHPQTDGQSEAIVKTIQQMLRPYLIRGSDWEQLLPALEFAYNNTVQASTKETPFFLNKGFHPNGIRREADGANPAASEVVAQLQRLFQSAKDNIAIAQERQARYGNKHRRDAEIFSTGEYVLLQRLKEQKEKLGPTADGPFKILKVGRNTVTLDLPSNSRAHPTVNISRVSKYHGLIPEHVTIPKATNIEPTYDVEKILAERLINGKKQYLIKWTGYTTDDNTWEPHENISKAALKKYQEDLQAPGHRWAKHHTRSGHPGST